MTKSILNTLREYKQLLPLLLITAYCMDAVIHAFKGTVMIEGVTYSFSPTPLHYIAFAAVIANFFTYFLLRRYYKYTLVLTIIAGLFGLMVFPALKHTINYSLNSLAVSYQPSALWAGILAYLINFKRVNAFIFGTVDAAKTKEKRAEHDAEMLTEETEKFKEIYKDYSNETLQEIRTDKKYLPGATMATDILLHNRYLGNQFEQFNKEAAARFKPLVDQYGYVASPIKIIESRGRIWSTHHTYFHAENNLQIVIKQEPCYTDYGFSFFINKPGSKEYNILYNVPHEKQGPELTFLAKAAMDLLSTEETLDIISGKNWKELGKIPFAPTP